MKSLSFESSLLRAVAEGFQKRSKALRHQTKALVITREKDINSSEPERLNIDAKTIEARPTQVRLSVWSDGVLWFRACQPTKAGWSFMLAFHGQLKTSATRDMEPLFEKSLGLVYGATRKSECDQQLLSLWRAVSPVVANDAQQGVPGDVAASRRRA
jgi:hypothetical protein